MSLAYAGKVCPLKAPVVAEAHKSEGEYAIEELTRMQEAIQRPCYQKRMDKLHVKHHSMQLNGSICDARHQHFSKGLPCPPLLMGWSEQLAWRVVLTFRRSLLIMLSIIPGNGPSTILLQTLLLCTV